MWVGPILCWLRDDPDAGRQPRLRGRRRGVAREDATEAPARNFAAPLGLLAFWALIVFLEAMGEGSVRMFFNVLMDTGLQVPTATIGLVMGEQLLPIAVALALPLLLARWGTGYTLLGGAFALAACLCPFALGAQMGMQTDGWVGWAVGLIQRRLPGLGGDNDRAGYPRHVWPGDRNLHAGGRGRRARPCWAWRLACRWRAWRAGR